MIVLTQAQMARWAQQLQSAANVLTEAAEPHISTAQAFHDAKDIVDRVASDMSRAHDDLARAAWAQALQQGKAS